MGRIKIPGFLKVVPHTLKQTGHYCDGRFDENHMDFETFCGLSHTRKTALPLAVAMLGYIVMNALILGLLHIDSIMIGALFFLPFILLLIIGIWFKRQLLMLPFIIIMLFEIVGTLIIVPLLIVALFEPNSRLFNFISECILMMGGTYDAQLTILLMVILETFSCTMGLFTTWSMYVHFCYIRGCRRMVQQELEAKQQAYTAEKKLTI